MTTTAFNYDDTYDPSDDYEDDGVDWYCNHDVPNGCHDCAWLRREDAMLAAMTPDERQAYWTRYDNLDCEPF